MGVRRPWAKGIARRTSRGWRHGGAPGIGAAATPSAGDGGCRNRRAPRAVGGDRCALNFSEEDVDRNGGAQGRRAPCDQLRRRGPPHGGRGGRGVFDHISEPSPHPQTTGRVRRQRAAGNPARHYRMARVAAPQVAKGPRMSGAPASASRAAALSPTPQAVGDNLDARQFSQAGPNDGGHRQE